MTRAGLTSAVVAVAGALAVFGGPAIAQSRGESSLQCDGATAYSRKDLTELGQVLPCFVRIRAGEPAVDDIYVAAIRFLYPNGGQELCSGILIGRQHVLTAGHCGCGDPRTYRVSFEPAVSDSNWAVGIPIDGAPRLFDPRICLSYFRAGNDLALLKLADKISAADVRDEYGYPGLTVWDLRTFLVAPQALQALGYGYTESGFYGKRMKADIPIQTPDCTQARYGGVCAPFVEMVLADNVPGSLVRRDTCGGDSGGPVILQRPNRNSKGSTRILVGVTSRAVPGLHQDQRLHCGGGGVYTLIGRQSVHAWLDANGVPKLQAPLQ